MVFRGALNSEGEFLVIRISANPIENGFVRIFDMTGRQVYCHEIKQGENHLNISVLKPAVYSVRINTEKKVYNGLFEKH